MTSDPRSVLRFSRDLVETGRDDHRLREGRAAASLVRLRRGAYVDNEAWSSADRDERYSMRIRAAVGTRQTAVVLSHFSAARLWGLPVANGWPSSVDITVPVDSSRRTKNGIRVHRRELRPDEVIEHDGVLLTSRARTLIDLAADADLCDAVVAADAALDRRRPTTTRSELDAILDRGGALHAERKTRRAMEFATDLAESPGESWSRVLIAELGFPAPILQQRFVTPSGSRFADFWWPDVALVGEFDGRGKYTADPFDTVLREKRRENELRETGVAAIVRWGVEELRAPEQLARRLRAAGLCSPLGTSRRRRES